MPVWWNFVATGILAGIASGMFGIGGGLVIIPVLVLLFKMDQHAANGTSLVALLLPVGTLAVWKYWQAGKIAEQHLKSGLWLAAGLFIGAYFGSEIAVNLSSQQLRRVFAVVMILAAGRMALT